MMAVAKRGGARSTTNGSVALEYGLVLPALLLFVLGIMDGGRLLWTNATLARATQAAARCAAVNRATCGTAAQIKTYAVSQAYGLKITTAAFTSTTGACGSQVSAGYAFQFLIPWISPTKPFGPSNSVTLKAAACYPPAYSPP